MDRGSARARPRSDPGPARDNDSRPLRLLRALTHPLRVAILARLDEDVLSPKELAGELGTSLPVVSYHVRELERTGMIELVRTAQRRGAVQHWYHTRTGGPLEERDWAAISARGRREIVAMALARLELAIASASAQKGGFDRAEIQMSPGSLALDDRGFDELAQMLREVRAKVAEISRAAESRVAAGTGRPARATLSVMLFEGSLQRREQAPPLSR
jgi:DNA-binding transcriptional ArsR family regulator